MLGVFRARPGGGGWIEPIDKRQLGQELVIAPGAEADAQDGDLVAAEVLRRNAIRIAELPSSQDHLIILDQ